MPRNRFSPIALGATFRRAGVFVLGAGFVAIVGAAAPAQVARFEARIVAATPIACSATGAAACFNVTDSSSGIAVHGTSNSGTGLRGTSTSNYGLKATSTSNDGIYGQSSSGAAAIYGTMKNKVGILGADMGDGVGVEGTAVGGGSEPVENGIGVEGSSAGTNGAGVLGVASTGANSIGVGGYSASGLGAFGETTAGTAVFAEAIGKGKGLEVLTGSGTAIEATSDSGIGAQIVGSTYGILGRAPTNGLPLVLQDASDNNLFYVDGSGNVSYKGNLQSFALMRSGGSAIAYGSRSTAPTLEDSGSAHLANGSANVVLDKTFASTIDTKSAYRVFLTPGGDSRGLYVASKSPSGFVVRESQGGRSTLDFDYRILAVAMGHATDRMAQSRTTGPTVPTVPTPMRMPRRTLPPVGNGR